MLTQAPGMNRSYTFVFRQLSAFLISAFFCIENVCAQPGCTDPQASNYSVGATSNDGSCIYASTNLNLTRLAGLDAPLLDESSGVSFFNDQLWTHVDNTDANIYRLDSSSGLSAQEITVVNATNTDWEDITTGNGYVFIGDFGNNSGNRSDLKILRLDQSSINDTSSVLIAEAIQFAYPDQVDFTPALNATRYDCEAFFYHNDSLHLFCKDWINKHTCHYTVPAAPGFYMATLVDSFDVDGLVTSAARASDGSIVLLGYDNVIPAPCFLWLLYDYSGTSIFSGNKRRFSLGTALNVGQVEGICFRNNHFGYITNERFQQLVFNVDPQLWSFDLGQYIQQVTTSVPQASSIPNQLLNWPNPFSSVTTFQLSEKISAGATLVLMNTEGKIVRTENLDGTEFQLNRQSLTSGMYFYRVLQTDGPVFQGKIIVE